jgi:hypothetical protein
MNTNNNNKFSQNLNDDMAQLMTPEKPRERKYALVQSKYLSKMKSSTKINLKQPTQNDE